MTTEMTAAQRDALRFLRNGMMSTRMLGVAVRLGVPEALQSGPLDEEALARETGTHPRSVGRLVRALAALGVFEEHEGDRFGLTSMSELLLANHPSSLRAAVLYYDSQYVREA